MFTLKNPLKQGVKRAVDFRTAALKKNQSRNMSGRNCDADSARRTESGAAIAQLGERKEYVRTD